MTGQGFPTGSYTTVAEALSDLRDRPTDDRGWARSACFVLAELNWHVFDTAVRSALLARIASEARKHFQLPDAFGPFAKVVESGQPIDDRIAWSIATTDGHVNLWLRAPGMVAVDAGAWMASGGDVIDHE